MGEDLVDHRGLRDEGDDAHRAVAGGTGERVDLENLLQEGRPSASGFGRRESCGGDDEGWRIGCYGLSLSSHPARTVGVPAVVPCRDLPLVRNVHEHPGQEATPAARAAVSAAAVVGGLDALASAVAAADTAVEAAGLAAEFLLSNQKKAFK